MSENLEASPSHDPLQSVADAMENAVLAARNGAADAREHVERAIPQVNRFVSRLVYTTCYTLSYGVVFPTVFLARSIPKDNALVHGLIDGAHAARDMVDEMKRGHVGGSIGDNGFGPG